MISQEFEIRRAARYLQSLMHELHEYKYMKGKSVGEVVSGGAGFGPRAPGNETAMSLYCEIERELAIWLRDWKPSRHGVQDQLGWVAFEAEWVAAQADSDSFLDELRRWATLVEKATGRGPTIKDLAATDPYLTAHTIKYRLKQDAGLTVTVEQIRLAARHNKGITMRKKGNRNTYRYREILDHFAKD